MSLFQLQLPIPPSSIRSHHAARMLAGIQSRGKTVNNKAQTTGADGLLYCPQKCKQWMSLLGGLRHSASAGYGMITAATWHCKFYPNKLRENTKITKSCWTPLFHEYCNVCLHWLTQNVMVIVCVKRHSNLCIWFKVNSGINSKLKSVLLSPNVL